MEEACDSRSKFEIDWIIETAAAKNRRDTKPFVAPKPLTDVERHASDLAAIKSLLWLHYKHDWPLSEFGGRLLGKKFAEQRGISADDVPAVLEAKEAYPRETILKWMDDTVAP